MAHNIDKTLKLDKGLSPSTILIRGSTKIVGIFGDPLTYTLSPKMHNYAFSKLKLNYAYLPFVVKPENLKTAVDSIRSLNMVGINVTIPHKQTIVPYLDSLTMAAQTIGAVNTIINEQGKLLGDNTDGPGFLATLKSDGKFDPKNKKVLIYGAGGVAHAIAVTLLKADVKKIVLLNRTFKKAQALARRIKKISKKDISALEMNSSNLVSEIDQADLLVNATPTGIRKGDFPIEPEKFLKKKHFVFDSVYSYETHLIKAAKKTGAKYLDGLGMLIHQGALSFSKWTGLKPPVDLMRKGLEEFK